MTYAGCNTAVNLFLRPVAFSGDGADGIIAYMARKATSKQAKHHATYLRAWRLKRGFTQQAFIERLDTLLEGVPAEERKVPKTAASLSRIENGEQPYNQQSLEAFAAVLGIAAWQILSDNPAVESTVVTLDTRLSAEQIERLKRVADEMFPRDGTTG